MPHERAGVLPTDTRTHAHTCVCKRLELFRAENQKPMTKNGGRGIFPPYALSWLLNFVQTRVHAVHFLKSVLVGPMTLDPSLLVPRLAHS